LALASASLSSGSDVTRFVTDTDADDVDDVVDE
jgi:hypothetical protein